LWRAAEKTKEILSTIQETELRVDCLLSDIDFARKISRNLLDSLAKAHLDKIPVLIRNALASASLTLEQLDTVEALGGGLRIPLVQERVKSAIAPKELGFRLDSAHCIAIGAALYARIIDKTFDYVIEDPAIVPLPEPSLSAEEIQVRC
jgi:molecular chaperone DnaK (HSP70)